MRSNIALDGRGIGLDQREALRQALEVLELGRPLGLAAERPTQRVAELHRQGGLQADERHAGLAVLEADLQPVRGMGVDHLPVFLEYAADGGKAVVVGALARNQTGLRYSRPVRRAREVELAFGVQPPPEVLDARGVAA